MNYSNFEEALLVGAFVIAEQTGEDFVPVRTILSTFKIDGQLHWLSRAISGLVSRGELKDTRTLGGGIDQDVWLTAAGARRAESWMWNHGEPVRGHSNLLEATELQSEMIAGQKRDDNSELDRISDQLAPASDRVVLISDNAHVRNQIAESLNDISSTISQSNLLDPDEKSDVLESLGLAQRLLQNSRRVLVGALRYLVFERLKKAFERSIEDVYRAMIIGALGALALIILAAS